MAITIFTPAANDLSLEYLYTIFGNMNGLIKAAEKGTTQVTILGTMFSTFNTAILAVGAFMVVYVTIVGVMATAHEGEFMGKKWNNMWLPIRTVLGIAALVPTASGYSAIQIIMMWFIMQGIGAADTVWSSTLSFMQVTQNPFAKIKVSMDAKAPDGTVAGLSSIGAKQALKDIYKGVVCHETTRQKFESPYMMNLFILQIPMSAGYYCKTHSYLPICIFPPSVTFAVPMLQASRSLNLGPNRSCGTINYCNYQKLCVDTTVTPKAAGDTPAQTKARRLCETCKSQIDALSRILIEYAEQATSFAQTDFAYSKYFYSKADPDTAPPFIKEYCKEAGIKSDRCKGGVSVVGEGDNTRLEADADGLPPPYTTNTMDQSASAFVVSDIYSPLLDAMGKNNPSKLSFIDVTALEYQEATKLQDGEEPKLEGVYDDAGKQGWLVAGAYYYTISGFVKEEIDSLIPPLSYSAPEPGLLMPNNMLQSACGGLKCRTNFEAASYFLSELSESSGSNAKSNPYGARSSGSSSTNELAAPVGDAGNAVSATLAATMSGSVTDADLGRGASDPVATLIVLGSSLLYIVGITYGVLIVLFLITGLAGNVSVFALGTGFINPVGPAATLVSMLILPAVFGFLGILLALGGTLGIYVPLIPFVIFTLGAIGWFTSVIEAMIAGPLVALGILSPSGQHELLGKAEPAIGLLFNICLRPTLMIFGLVAAILLSGVMIDLLNSTFGIIFRQISDVSGAGGLIGLVLYLCAYVSLVVVVLNKCFAAIHIIPEKVGRWIGMQGEQYGESTDALKGAVDSGSSQSAQATSTAGNRASEAKRVSKKAKEDKEKEEAAKLKAEKDK